MPKSGTAIAVEDGAARVKAACDLALRNTAGLEIAPLADFLESIEGKTLSPEQKIAIIHQAEILFANFYSHWPFKLDTYPNLRAGDSPAQFLFQARAEVGLFAPQPTAWQGELTFHSNIFFAFAMVRDAHTLYGRPAPFRDAIAFLPFEMMSYKPANEVRYRHVITKVMAGFEHPHFGPGAVIQSWNGQEMTSFLTSFAQRLWGGNVEAIFARAALCAGMRPLTYVDTPIMMHSPEAELEATIEYLPRGGGATQRISLPWNVATGMNAALNFSATPSSVSMFHQQLEAGTGALYHAMPAATSVAQEAMPSASSPLAGEPKLLTIIRGAREETFPLPETFEVQFSGGLATKQWTVNPADLVASQDGTRKSSFGYIRIKKFNDAGAGLDKAMRIAGEFGRLVALMEQSAPDGLILDIRSNGGGEIQAAEQMFQYLTPVSITPANFHYPNTPAMIRTIQAGTSNSEFEPWQTDQPPPPYERLTQGKPLTTKDDANRVGQVYQGPVVLLIDARTYSAAEVFAAGFQDHGIGTIIGIDAHTGGGGANVWKHEDLLSNIGKNDIGLQPLPSDASMTIAIRRLSRVGGGLQWVEDSGVEADLVYAPASDDDVIDGYPGLFRFACDQLFQAACFRVKIQPPQVHADHSVVMDLVTRNVDTVDVFLVASGKPAPPPSLVLAQQAVSRNADGTGSLKGLSANIFAAPVKIIVKGFTTDSGQPVLRTSCHVDVAVEQPQHFVSAIKRTSK